MAWYVLEINGSLEVAANLPGRFEYGRDRVIASKDSMTDAEKLKSSMNTANKVRTYPQAEHRGQFIDVRLTRIKV